MKKNRLALWGVILMTFGMFLGLFSLLPAQSALADTKNLGFEVSYVEKEDGGVIKVRNLTSDKKIKVVDVNVKKTKKLKFTVVGMSNEAIMPGENKGAVRFKIERISPAVTESSAAPSTTAAPVQPVTSELPKTGEQAGLQIAALIMIASGAALLVVSRKNRRTQLFMVLLLTFALTALPAASGLAAQTVRDSERSSYTFKQPISFDGESEEVSFILILEFEKMEPTGTSAAESSAAPTEAPTVLPSETETQPAETTTVPTQETTTVPTGTEATAEPTAAPTAESSEPSTAIPSEEPGTEPSGTAEPSAEAGTLVTNPVPGNTDDPAAATDEKANPVDTPVQPAFSKAPDKAADAGSAASADAGQLPAAIETMATQEAGLKP